MNCTELRLIQKSERGKWHRAALWLRHPPIQSFQALLQGEQLGIGVVSSKTIFQAVLLMRGGLVFWLALVIHLWLKLLSKEGFLVSIWAD